MTGVHPAPFVVASAETLSYAVATGEIGDPRSFKRPVRVTVPRALPTDDVLVIRERRAADAGARKGGVPAVTTPSLAVPTPWKGAHTLDLVEVTAFLSPVPTNGKPRLRVAVLCATLDEVRTIASHTARDASQVGAVIAPFIPSGVVALLSGLGVLAIEIDDAAMRSLLDAKGAKTIALPAPGDWGEREVTSITVGEARLPLVWLALGIERGWTAAGTAAPPREGPKPARR